MEPVDRRVPQPRYGSNSDPSRPNTVSVDRIDPKPNQGNPVSPDLTRHFTVSDLHQTKVTMKQIGTWIINRLKEGSSWAGLAILASALGISQDIAVAGYDVLVAAAGLLALILKDKPDTKPEGEQG